MYLNSIELNEDYEDTMFVRNVVKGLKQHEHSTLITSRVGTNFPKIDMIEITEWCCVSDAITLFIGNTNLKPLISQSCCGNI